MGLRPVSSLKARPLALHLEQLGRCPPSAISLPWVPRSLTPAGEQQDFIGIHYGGETVAMAMVVRATARRRGAWEGRARSGSPARGRLVRDEDARIPTGARAGGSWRWPAERFLPPPPSGWPGHRAGGARNRPAAPPPGPARAAHPLDAVTPRRRFSARVPTKMKDPAAPGRCCGAPPEGQVVHGVIIEVDAPRSRGKKPISRLMMVDLPLPV